jgi:hypothetical protein
MVFDLFFRVGPAIIAIFELGYEPKRELFHELTEEHYAQLKEEGGDLSKKWFTILPDNPKHEVSELLIVDEDEMEALLDGLEYIERLCTEEKSGRKFNSFQDKLKYAASVLPATLSESTPFESYGKRPALKVVK